jgi:hypothetical protein
MENIIAVESISNCILPPYCLMASMIDVPPFANVNSPLCMIKECMLKMEPSVKVTFPPSTMKL